MGIKLSQIEETGSLSTSDLFVVSRKEGDNRYYSKAVSYENVYNSISNDVDTTLGKYLTPSDYDPTLKLKGLEIAEVNVTYTDGTTEQLYMLRKKKS